jgi:Ni,Fe-hydrogenase I large subunit
MRGTIDNQVKQIWKILDGIGTSKVENKKSSNRVGLNGKNVSEKIHSFKTKDNTMARAKQLGNYAKEQFGIKDMQSITKEVIQSFINDKIEKGLTKRTLSTYIGQLHNISFALDSMKKNPKIDAHNKLFNKEDLNEVKKDIDKQAISTKHKNRAYNNPNLIQSNLKNRNLISFRLQKDYGLRVAEATQIQAKQLLGNNKIEIQGKGGYKLIKEIDKNIYNQIKNIINKDGIYKLEYRDYTNSLKETIKLNDENWHGTHGLRYNYAQNKFKEYQEQGFNYNESLEKVSNDLGHHRTDITIHYLKASE